MFHEFEEILFLKYWLKKDKEYLNNKFPKTGSKIYLQYNKFTTAGFVLAVAEEFILISILCYSAIILDNYYIWFTVFIGFSIHIAIHIIQWMVYRKYIPTIITSTLVLPYCIYGFMMCINNGINSLFWIMISSIIGTIGVLINLQFIHYLGKRFSKWEIKNN